MDNPPDRGAWERASERVQNAVRESFGSMYASKPCPPPYALELTSAAAVERALRLADAALMRLLPGSPEGTVLRAAPSELAVCWSQLLRDQFDRSVLREPLGADELLLGVAHGVCSGIYHARVQAARNRRVLEEGPPGATFPELPHRKECREMPVDFGRLSAGLPSQRHDDFLAHYLQTPRRRQGLRSRDASTVSHAHPALAFV